MGSLSQVQTSSLFTFDLLDLNPSTYKTLHSPTSTTTDSYNDSPWFPQMFPLHEQQHEEQQEQQQAHLFNTPGYIYPTAAAVTHSEQQQQHELQEQQEQQEQQQMQHAQHTNLHLYNYNYGTNYSSYTSSPTMNQSQQPLYQMPSDGNLFGVPLTQQPSGGVPLQGFVTYPTAVMPSNIGMDPQHGNSGTYDFLKTNSHTLTYPLSNTHSTTYYSSSTSPTLTAASLEQSRGGSSVLQDIQDAKRFAATGVGADGSFCCTYQDCRYKGTFHTEEYLKRHIKEQHLECKRYVCQGDKWGCGKVFKRPYQLVNHWKARRSLLRCNVPMEILRTHCIEKDMNVLSKKLKRRRRWQR